MITFSLTSLSCLFSSYYFFYYYYFFVVFLTLLLPSHYTILMLLLHCLLFIIIFIYSLLFFSHHFHLVIMFLHCLLYPSCLIPSHYFLFFLYKHQTPCVFFPSSQSCLFLFASLPPFIIIIPRCVRLIQVGFSITFIFHSHILLLFTFLPSLSLPQTFRGICRSSALTPGPYLSNHLS